MKQKIKWEAKKIIEIILKYCGYSLMAGTARSEAFCYENRWNAFCFAGMSGNIIH